MEGFELGEAVNHRALVELSDDIRRQSSYAANERNDLNTMAVAIKNGELFGTSLANRSFGGGAMASATPGGASFPAPASTGVAGRRPAWLDSVRRGRL